MTSNSSLPKDFIVQRLTDGDNDYARYQFPRTDGRAAGTLIMPLDEATAKRSVKSNLQRAGVAIPETFVIDTLVQALISAIPTAPGILTRRPGWTGEYDQKVFVTPRVVYGSTALPIVFHSVLGKTINMESAGTLDGWRAAVANPAVNSTPVATAILASMSGPLLRYSELTESFLINLAGNSSSGKSTANRAALSVWGPPDGLASWNASDRGMAEMAYDNNDLVLVLDDIEQGEIDPSKRIQKAVAALHQLVSGQGKNYSRVVRGENHLPSLDYKTVFLSSSPSTLLSPTGTDGDIVRLLEVNVPHGDVGGIWHRVSATEPDRTAAMSDNLTSGARQNHGLAGHLWLTYLVEHQSSLSKKVKALTDGFVAFATPRGSLETRIAKKAGLLYAAAVLAVEAGILPWKVKRCLEVVNRTYRAFISSAHLYKKQQRRLLKGLYKASLDKTIFLSTADAPSKITISKTTAIGCMYYSESKMAFKLTELEKLVLPGPLEAKAVVTSTLQLLKEDGLIDLGTQGSLTKDVRFSDGPQKMLVLNRQAFADALVRWGLATPKRSARRVLKKRTKK